MEIGPDPEQSQKEQILVVCAAGVNRSGMMREVLSERGYEVFNRGVINNFVEPHDLTGVGTIVFASPHERKIFESKPELMQKVAEGSIKVLEINITQSDLDRAVRDKKTEELRKEIGKQLEEIGFKEKDQAP